MNAWDEFGEHAWVCETCDTFTPPGIMVCKDCEPKPMPPAGKRAVNRVNTQEGWD